MAKEMFVLKDCDFVLGDEATGPNFKCEVKKVAIGGEAPIIKAKTACPTGTYSEAGTAEREITVTFLTMWDESEIDETIFDFCLAHVGEKMPVFFRPKAGGRGYTGTTTIPAGTWSGEVDGSTDESYTFPIDGELTPVAATP